MLSSMLLWQGCLNDLSFDLFPEKPLNQCKSSCFIFQGTVYDPNNSVPLSASIDLYYNSGGFPSFSKYLGDIKSNSKGEYAVNFDGTDYTSDWGYFVLVTKLDGYLDGYLTSGNDGQVVISNLDSTHYDIPVMADIPLRPKATLQFEFDIKYPTLLQSLSYSYKYAGTRYIHSPRKDSWSLDTLYTHPVAGDQYVHSWIEYKQNNQIYEIRDSVYLKKGEVKTITSKIN